MKNTKHKMFFRKFICCCLIASSSLSLTGCSIFRRDTTTSKNTVTTVDNIDNLAENAYYVQHGDIYYKLYIGNTSFKKGKSATKADDDRIAWFGDNYNRIPTMYKGDSIVFHTSQPFTEKFVIERFEDIGYTIGICNLKELDSGRFSFSTNPEKLNINMGSDAKQVTQETEIIAVLDKIGGTDLRANNISRAGTVLGLAQGKTYKCDIYFGTNINEFKLVADSRALVSMESVTLKNYEYTQSKTISFKFPSYFNSGYYYVNGYGLVRYIASGNSFSEEIDMNIPNVYPDNDDEDYEIPEYTRPSEYKDLREENFSIANDETITVTITYEVPDNDSDYTVPVAKVIGDYNAYTLNSVSNGLLEGTFKLPSGDYTIQIMDLKGRSYSYKVSKGQESEGKTEPDTSNNGDDSDKLSIADQIKAAEKEKKGE